MHIAAGRFGLAMNMKTNADAWMAAELSELSRRAERAGRGLAAMVRWGRSRCRLAIVAAVLVLGWVGGAPATAQLTTATWTGAAGDSAAGAL
jgi:hypothetical protein